MSNAIQYVERTPKANQRLGGGGLATVYYCPFCEEGKLFVVTVPKGVPGRVGRGYGLATSSQARAKVAKHIHSP